MRWQHLEGTSGLNTLRAMEDHDDMLRHHKQLCEWDKKLIVDNCKVMYIKIKYVHLGSQQQDPKYPNETPAKSTTARKEEKKKVLGDE